MMGGAIRLGLFYNRARRHATSTSPKRAASGGGVSGFLPFELTPGFLKTVGGIATVGGCVVNFGPSVENQNKRLEKLETRIDDIDNVNQTQHKNIEGEVHEIKKDIAVLKEQSKSTCEDTKYIRKRLDRRWF